MSNAKYFWTIMAFFLVVIACNTANEKKPDKWFPFNPSNSIELGVIGMQDWLDAPAGKHGFLSMDKENLRFEDGTPIKLWGTNICSNQPYVPEIKADSFVNFIAKYGINAVRFHKFTWSAYDGIHSTRLAPEKFKRFDYFQSQLRKKGIYYGWSHIYGHKVLPGDSSQVLAYAEVKNLNYPWSHLNGTSSSLVNFAPDLQELNITLTVNMLNHINPYTGLRYADDPGLAFIEFQNEDNIFWAAIERTLEQAPTYRAMLCEQFSDWLQNKYISQHALEEAWGKGILPEGESLQKKNIYPQPNHSLFSREYKTSKKEHRSMATHLLDKMKFLYDKQVDFYQKFEKAIRATGYKGVLVGSCWQAGSGISHLYNLHADYTVGMIDRHNYFGGGAGGHRLDTGKVRSNSMLAEPGSALLSSGMQQIVNRPFSFSEWMSLVPNEWTAEAAPIIAAYGMGLQGWDASFSFATDLPRFSTYLQSERYGVYNATSPLHMGLYPTLARMVYRNDVTESEIIATRNADLGSLENGMVGFEENVDQGYDDKRFSGSVSPQTLAIGRIPIQFTEKFQETIVPDLSVFQDTIAKWITSATKELQWFYGEQDYFTINTSGTKGVVGFMPDKNIVLGDWAISSDNTFAVILITSLEQNKGLNDAEKILVTTIARARNTGMAYSSDGKKLLSEGTTPLLLEPVNMILKMPDISDYQMEVLDHDGFTTGKFLQSSNDEFFLSGFENNTFMYLLKRK